MLKDITIALYALVRLTAASIHNAQHVGRCAQTRLMGESLEAYKLALERAPRQAALAGAIEEELKLEGVALNATLLSAVATWHWLDEASQAWLAANRVELLDRACIRRELEEAGPTAEETMRRRLHRSVRRALATA